MKVENGKIILEKKNCTSCNEGTIPSKIQCKACKGTGNGPRGGKGGCRKCYSGYVWDKENRVPCAICKGNYVNFEYETICDYLPEGTLQSLPFKVYRSDRHQTANEHHFGIGCVYSMSDYGAHRNLTDDQLIAQVKEYKGLQGSKIANKEGQICDHIGIFCNNNGYSVRPIFSPIVTDAMI